jgi:hypothetical protein
LAALAYGRRDPHKPSRSLALPINRAVPTMEKTMAGTTMQLLKATTAVL